MDRIPIAGPDISQREIDYAADAAAQGWYERAGDYPRRFEAAFAEYIGVKHAVSLPSCTSGLHLALVAVGAGGITYLAERTETGTSVCAVTCEKRGPIMKTNESRKL